MLVQVRKYKESLGQVSTGYALLGQVGTGK